MDYEVQAAVSALGYLDGDKYQKEADCFETIKDLIRYLRRDGESRSIRRHLGESNLAENDLVPILITYPDDLPLFDATLRLLINLTQPAAQSFNGKIPPDFSTRQTFLEIHDHLRKSKRCFTKEPLYKILHAKLTDLLKLEEDRISIERLLSLLKNILALPAAEEDQRRTDTDITLQDQILWALHRSGLEDVIFSIAERHEERRFHLLILEIIGLMLKDHKTEQLANAGLERSDIEKKKDEQVLQRLHEKAKAQQYANLKRCSGRHSNFAGSYVVHGMKSIIDERDIVLHKVLTKDDDVTLDDRKKRKRLSKNRAPLLDEIVERKSALTIRLFLRQFCERFLEKYANFIDSVRQLLSRVDRRQHMTECYYIWCIRFFTEFARNSSNVEESLKFVIPTVSVHSFHYLLMQMNDYYEMMKTDKFEAVTWGKRTCLKDLVECVHVYMKLFELHCQVHGGEIKIQKKQRKRKTKKKKNKNGSTAQEDSVETEEQIKEKFLEEKENQWDIVSGDLSAALQGHIDLPSDAVPFDVLAEHGFDEKTVAKVRIQESLKKNEPAVSVAFLRASRQLWPEDKEIFGDIIIEPEDEFLLLRQIFFTETPKIVGENCPPVLEESENVIEDDEDNEEEVANEEYEDVETGFVTKEVDFSFLTYVQRFARYEILTWYIWLLEDFESNASSLNHCILKLFHRIVYELKCAGILYQARLFRIFQKVSSLPAFKKLTHLEEIVEFAKHFLRQFFELASKNKKIYVEILFWKNAQEVYELEYGYGSFKVDNPNKKKSKKKKKEEEFVENLNENWVEEGEKIFDEENAVNSSAENDELQYSEKLNPNKKKSKKKKSDEFVENLGEHFLEDEKNFDAENAMNFSTENDEFQNSKKVKNPNKKKSRKKKNDEFVENLGENFLDDEKNLFPEDNPVNFSDENDEAEKSTSNENVDNDDKKYENFDAWLDDWRTAPSDETEGNNDIEEVGKLSTEISGGEIRSDTESVDSPIKVKRVRRIISDDEED